MFHMNIEVRYDGFNFVATVKTNVVTLDRKSGWLVSKSGTGPTLPDALAELLLRWPDLLPEYVKDRVKSLECISKWSPPAVPPMNR